MRRSTQNQTAYIERRGLIANDYLRGMSQSDLARKHGVNQSTISRDLEAIRQEWIASTLVDFGQAKARELAKIDRLESEYWDAWERSVGEVIKTTTSKSDKDGSKASIVKEKRVGDSSYLSGVAWCIEQRCKIFGIYEATKITFDWRKAVEEQGHDAGDLFERMVNAYLAAVNTDPDGEADR